MNRKEYNANHTVSCRYGRSPGHHTVNSTNDYDIDSMLSSRSIPRDSSCWQPRRSECYDRRLAHMSTPQYTPMNTPVTRNYDYTTWRDEYDKPEPCMKREFSAANIVDRRPNDKFKGFTSTFPNNTETMYQNDDLDFTKRTYPPESDHLTSVSMRTSQPTMTDLEDTRHRPQCQRDQYQDDYPLETNRSVIDNKNKVDHIFTNPEQNYSAKDAASIASKIRPLVDDEKSWEAKMNCDTLSENKASQYNGHLLSPCSFKRECHRVFKEARAQRMRNLEEGLYSKCDWATYDIPIRKTMSVGAAMEIRESTTFSEKPKTVSRKPVYFFIFLLIISHFVTFYWSYSNILNLQSRYETVYWELHRQSQSQYLHTSSHSTRSKRQTLLQNNVIVPKNSVIDNNETSKNKSAPPSHQQQQQEDTYNFRNYSAEDWIWLNKYSRVPIKVLEEFCKITHEKCPTQKGIPGAKGDAGEKGEKGDVGGSGADGKPGPIGHLGPKGPPGLKGDRGEKGEHGWSGLDGRPGIPGEPGLDGIPGRNGKDGTPGKDGSGGRDGIPGIPGRNGKDGDRGEKGDKGDAGPQGPTGLPGTRGKPGRAGADGIPGIPGISSKNCSVNGTNTLLVAPAIVGSDFKYFIENITVNEYENVQLKCSSTGVPKPVNVWRRIKEDQETGALEQLPVNQGQWAGVNWDTDSLQFMNVSRKHMGKYMCIANNAIPPAANATYHLNVHFPPYIEIDNVILNVTTGGTARLQCKIETYPHGVYYWEDSYGAIYEEKINDFISVDYYHISLYETILEMNITKIRKDQMGIYYCIGKNKKGITRGYINVTDDPGTELDVTDVCHKNRVKFGNPAPPADGEICPECPHCKICGFGYRDLEIRSLITPDIQSNTSFIRARRCQLEAIGKAVFHNSWPNQYGSWMRETYSNSQDREDTYYLTLLDNCTQCLYKFDSKVAFTNKTFSSKFHLSDKILGNDHVIFNGSFYYATMKDRALYVVRYDLVNRGRSLLKLSYCDISPENYLYKSENNFVDVMSDENGLWAVCALTGSNNTIVWKLNTTSQQQFLIERAWNISVKHQDAGDMFIICGILYAVDNVTAPITKISLALDLYEGKLLDDTNYINFHNPFSNTTMISYNYKNNELNTWDDGNMLTYPIKCQDLDSGRNTNETSTVTDLAKTT